MFRIICRYVAVLPSLLLLSCVNVGTPAQRAQKAQRLSADLQQLSPKISADEAQKLATTAIEESAKMSRDFKPLCFPWMNNALVNTGLRKRGLCYQWRDDLFPHLHRLGLKTMDLHLASSRRATMLEHNGIVVTAKGQPFAEGIILDPWRRGGRLWWGTLKQDRLHPWKPLPRELTPEVLRPLLTPEWCRSGARATVQGQ